MHKRFVSSKQVVFIFTLFCLILIAFSSPTAFATDFEIGTLFGISRASSTNPDVNAVGTYTRLPSGSLLNIGASPTTLYALFYLTPQIGIGPEFSYGSTSLSWDTGWSEDTQTLSTLHLGGRAAFFLTDYALSSPYFTGRASLTQSSGEGDTESITSIGIGVGYQFVINTAFVLRFEGQYSRLMLPDADDSQNEFSLRIGIGTQFGN